MPGSGYRDLRLKWWIVDGEEEEDIEDDVNRLDTGLPGVSPCCVLIWELIVRQI